jgi:hypothetical protein
MIAKRSGRLMDGFYTRCRKEPRINCCNIPITLIDQGEKTRNVKRSVLVCKSESKSSARQSRHEFIVSSFELPSHIARIPPLCRA